MLSRRIIPCLDVREGRVVKGTRFRDHVDMGGIEELAARYRDEGADELVLYGRDRPAEAYRICLGRFFRGRIPPLRVIPFEESEQLSVRGLRRICRELPDQPRKIV